MAANSKHYNLDTMTHFLRMVWNGAPRELRILFAGGTVWSGLYDDPVRMAKAAAWVCANANPSGVYFGLQGVGRDSIPHVCAGQINKLQRRPKFAVKAQHIVYSGLIMVDIDSVHPSGVCATEDEKEEARKVMQAVTLHLVCSQGFPQPIVHDTGNGYHLYWPASCAPGHAAWRYMLQWLAASFNTEGAKIDTSVADAARIARLPGTLNAKGPDTTDRPHRLSRLISYPETLTAPPPIYNIAKTLGYTDDYDREAAYAKRRAEGDVPELVIDEEGVGALIEEFPDQLDLYRTAHKDGRTYFYLGACPFNGGPHRDQFTGKTAIILSPESLGFRCFSSDCESHGFSDLLRLLKRETGRAPSMRIYGEPDYSRLYRYYKRWGGVTDVNREDRKAAKAARRLAVEIEEAKLLDEIMTPSENSLILDPEIRWDGDTFRTIESGVLRTMNLTTDPAAWGLDRGDLLNYVRQVRQEPEIISEFGKRDLAGLGELFGVSRLYDAMRFKTRPIMTSEWSPNFGNYSININPHHTWELELKNEESLGWDSLPPPPPIVYPEGTGRLGDF